MIKNIVHSTVACRRNKILILGSGKTSIYNRRYRPILRRFGPVDTCVTLGELVWPQSDNKLQERQRTDIRIWSTYIRLHILGMTLALTMANIVKLSTKTAQWNGHYTLSSFCAGNRHVFRRCNSVKTIWGTSYIRRFKSVTTI